MTINLDNVPASHAHPFHYEHLRHVLQHGESLAAFEARTGFSIDDLMGKSREEVGKMMPRLQGDSTSLVKQAAELQAWKAAYNKLLEDQNARLAEMQERLDKMAAAQMEAEEKAKAN